MRNFLFLIIPFFLFAAKEEKTLFEPGYSLNQESVKKDFFSSGRIKIHSDFDGFVAPSFLYWQAIALGLDIAAIQKDLSSRLTDVKQSEWKLPFNGAFKIRLGTNLKDNWIIFFDFLHFSSRQKTHVLANLSENESLIPAGWVGVPFGPGIPYNAACTFHLKYTEFLLSLGRSLYLGTRLIFFPYIGLTWDFISEKAKTSLIRTYQNEILLSKSDNYYNCSAVGPRIAFEIKYLLGAGFRIEGKAGCDLLYRKGKLKTQRWDTYEGELIPFRSYNDEALTLLRASMDMGLGLGWGRYLDNHKKYLDLYAGYEFKTLWDQQTIGAEETSALNFLLTLNPQSLFFHGLTVTLGLNF